MKIVWKLAGLGLLGIATAALFLSPDGAAIIRDIDREVFSGVSFIVALIVWIVVLRWAFGRKKQAATSPA